MIQQSVKICLHRIYSSTIPSSEITVERSCFCDWLTACRCCVTAPRPGLDFHCEAEVCEISQGMTTQILATGSRERTHGPHAHPSTLMKLFSAFINFTRRKIILATVLLKYLAVACGEGSLEDRSLKSLRIEPQLVTWKFPGMEKYALCRGEEQDHFDRGPFGRRGELSDCGTCAPESCRRWT